MTTATLTVERTTAGKKKRWAIDVRVLEQVEDDAIDFGSNPMYQAKQHLKSHLRDGVDRSIVAWTDGSKRTEGETAVYGCGMHVESTAEESWDLACRVTGIGSVLGAELTPLVKLMQWCDPHKQLTIMTDSQATIDVWTRLKWEGYSDRELTNHTERNAICALRAEMRAKPTLVRNTALTKVVSHTGVHNNEKADLLASMGTEGVRAVWLHMGSGQAYQLVDCKGEAIMGNLRKRMRKQDQNGIATQWRASTGPQGDYPRAIHRHNLRRTAGPHRTIMSHKKFLREINSIQQQQHKWRYGKDREAPPEFECPTCGHPYNSAAHRLHDCSCNAKHLILAQLKYKWTKATPPGTPKKPPHGSPHT